MSKKCNYLIRSNGGEFLLEIPSDSSVGSNRDFEAALYKYLTEHKIDKKTFKDSLVDINKELVVPAEINSIIVGQESLDSVSNNFTNTKLRNKIKYLSRELTKDWRSKKDKTPNPSTKQNIVFCSLDDKFDYEYNKEHDVIFINIAKTVDKNNVLKASLERAVNILGLANGDKSAAQLLKEHDPNVFNTLKISETSGITPSDISYLYFDHNNFNKESIVPFLSVKKDTYLAVVDKYAEKSSTDKRNDNYEPKIEEAVYNLKQGDLIALDSDKELSKEKSKGYYALFVDYSIDGNGNYVVKAISPNSKFPETRTLSSPIVAARLQRLSSDVEDTSEMNLSGPFYNVKLENKAFFNPKFLFKTIKRGDKVTIGVSDYVILNIRGSKLEVQNSKGEKSIIDNVTNINSIKLNSKVHGNLEFVNSELSNDFKEIKLTSVDDKKFIDVNDVVEWGENKTKGLVIYKQDQLLYVKNLTTGEIEKIYTNSVSGHHIYIRNNQDIIPISNQSKELASIKPFEYGDWLESDHNWVEYYRGLALSRGDVIIKNNIPMIVLSSEQGLNRVYVYGEYLLFSDNALEGSIIATNRPQDPRFSQTSINKNSYYISNNPDEYSGAYEVNIIKNTRTGQIKAIPVNDEIKPHYVLLNKNIKEEEGFNNTDKLYAFKKNEISVKNAEYTSPVYDVRDNFQAIFMDIIPGTFVKFSKDSKDSKYWLVERKVGDAFVISHSFMRNNEVKTVKKLLRKSDSIDELRLPTYASAVLAKMNKTIGVKMSKDISTFTDKEVLTSSQSPEIIYSISELLKSKYKININFVSAEEMSEMDVDPETRAAVINGEYFINTDKATIAEPMHEFLHMVLASMKFSNYDMYRNLISSVANHPLFNQVSKVYGDTSFDNLEETFIRLFSDTVSNKIAEDGIFTEASFDNAIREGVKSMLALQEDLSNVSGYELLTSDVKSVLQTFGSNLIDNMTPMYNKENSKAIIEASTVIREFIKNGNLNEECNGM